MEKCLVIELIEQTRLLMVAFSCLSWSILCSTDFESEKTTIFSTFSGLTVRSWCICWMAASMASALASKFEQKTPHGL